MTLFRHLLWLVLFFSFLIQAGSASLFIWHHQSAINEHTQQQAANSAELLINGLLAMDLTFNRVSPSSLHIDIDSLIAPLIASGQYSAISVILNKQQVLYSNRLPLIVQATPNWFARQYGFETGIHTERRLVDGGELEVSVEMNLAMANRDLYRTIKTAAQWIFVGMILTGIALYYSLRLLLKPLAELERHALALSNKQFHSELSLPVTRELRQVALAINTMSRKLRQLFEEQLGTIGQARKLAYEDSLTGLPNALAFENYAHMELKHSESRKPAIIVQVRLNGLDRTNRELGRQQGDLLLRQFAQFWHTYWRESHSNAFVCRRSSAEFVVWLASSDLLPAQGLIQQFKTAFSQGQMRALSERLWIEPSYVVCPLIGDNTAWQGVYQELDRQTHQKSPLSENELSEDNRPKDDAQSLQMIIPKQDWPQFFARCLSEKAITFEFQPIFRSDTRQQWFAECLMRIPYQDQQLQGFQVWPAIEQLKLTCAFDRLVVQAALMYLHANPEQKLSINICDQTLATSEFLPWFSHTMSNYPDLTDDLFIEVQESFLEYPQAINSLITLSATGVQLVLDRVVARQQTIESFVLLPIAAIKFDVDLLAHYVQSPQKSSMPGLATASLEPTPVIAGTEQQNLFISSLFTLANTCDVEIIIDGIETKQQFLRAEQLQMAGLQGFYIGRPVASCQQLLSKATHAALS